MSKTLKITLFFLVTVNFSVFSQEKIELEGYKKEMKNIKVKYNPMKLNFKL